MKAKEQRKTVTEEAILQAAKNEFLENGYAGARMQAIADAANINKAMLHYYFRSKNALFQKILHDATSIISAQLGPALNGEGTVMQKLERLVISYIDTINKNPHIPMFVINELSRGSADFHTVLSDKLHAETLFSFTEQIRKEQKQGILKPLPPHHIILTVMSLTIFPFMAKPVLSKVLNIKDEHYVSLMEERKTVVMDILKNSFLVK